MVEVVPTILCQSLADAKKSAQRWVGLVEVVQIDFADGQFVPNQLPGVEVLGIMPVELSFECHMMVARPVEWLDELLEVPRVQTVVLHLESDGDMAQMGRRVQAAGRQFGVALKPDTPLDRVEPFLPWIDRVLLLGVDPGFNDQPFQNEVVNRVAQLRQRWPAGVIEVDGGMNPQTAPLVVSAGANIIAAGSYMSHGDPAKHLTELRQKALTG